MSEGGDDRLPWQKSVVFKLEFCLDDGSSRTQCDRDSLRNNVFEFKPK